LLNLTGRKKSFVYGIGTKKIIKNKQKK
jgi:hypothetical protein